MDYISQLKELNVKFIAINEGRASEIMSTEFSYYKLLEYASAFERYRSQPREGKFVNLDFAELYYLALIDGKLSRIIMNICLQIEQFLKTVFVSDVQNHCDAKMVLAEYYNSDLEYLKNNYDSEHYDILQEKYGVDDLSTLELYQFVDVVQLGTLERMMHFFYKEYANEIYNSEFAPFEKLLASMRRVRNAVAHNNSLLGRLDIKRENRALEASAFLGRKGVKSRMLQTNMSKAVVCDLCNVLFLYYKYVPGDKGEIEECFQSLDEKCCQKYGEIFNDNYTLRSVYDFMVIVLRIFSENFQKI